MRNLKKVLSLALAMVMLLGMMVVGAGAATKFEDASEIPESREVAAAVASTIKVLIGDENNNFKPTATLTRAEAAVILTRLDLGADAAAALTPTDASTFDDVGTGYTWAKPFIDYCAGNGYMVGVGGNKFAPARTLTAVEFATMLSRVLGYRDENEFKDGWNAVQAAALARKAGLGADVSVGSNDINRADMAQMVLNALVAPMVEYNGLNISTGDITINSPASVRRHSANITGKGTTYDGEQIQSNITPIRLCEEKFPTLKFSRKGENQFKEAYSVWAYRGVEITESKVALASISTDKREFNNGWITNVISNNFDPKLYRAYVNGADVTASVKTRDDITALTGNGRLVQVYVDPNDLSEIEKVVVIDTVPGEVTKVDSEGKLTIKLLATDSEVFDKDGKLVDADAKRNDQLTTNDKTIIEGEFKKGDLVLLNAYGKDPIQKGSSVYKVFAPEKLEQFVVRKNYKTNPLGDRYYTVDTADKQDYEDARNVVSEYNIHEFDVNNRKKDSVLFLDQYGYIVKIVDWVDTTPQDGLIAIKDIYQDVEGRKIVNRVSGVIANGETIELVYHKVGEGANPSSPEVGKIFTYEEKNGIYQLKPVNKDVDVLTSTLGSKTDHYVANVWPEGQTKELTFRSNDTKGNANTFASKYFYSDSVKFIYADSNNKDVTVLKGRQGVTEKLNVIAQALDKNNEIIAVFLEAEPDFVSLDDIIFVWERKSKDEVVGSDDQTIYYGYTAYNSDGTEIPEFFGTADKMDKAPYGKFYKKDTVKDGDITAYKPTGADNTKVRAHTLTGSDLVPSTITYANGERGDSFIINSIIDPDTKKPVELLTNSKTKVVDLVDGTITTPAELNQTMNKERKAVDVAVVYTKDTVNGTYDVHTIFVTKVGDNDTYVEIKPNAGVDVDVKWNGGSAVLDTDFTISGSVKDGYTVTKKGDADVTVVAGTGYKVDGNKVTITATTGTVTVKVNKQGALTSNQIKLDLKDENGENLVLTYESQISGSDTIVRGTLNKWPEWAPAKKFDNSADNTIVVALKGDILGVATGTADATLTFKSGALTQSGTVTGYAPANGNVTLMVSNTPAALAVYANVTSDNDAVVIDKQQVVDVNVTASAITVNLASDAATLGALGTAPTIQAVSGIKTPDTAKSYTTGTSIATNSVTPTGKSAVELKIEGLKGLTEKYAVSDSTAKTLNVWDTTSTDGTTTLTLTAAPKTGITGGTEVAVYGALSQAVSSGVLKVEVTVANKTLTYVFDSSDSTNAKKLGNITVNGNIKLDDATVRVTPYAALAVDATADTNGFTDGIKKDNTTYYIAFNHEIALKSDWAETTDLKAALANDTAKKIVSVKVDPTNAKVLVVTLEDTIDSTGDYIQVVTAGTVYQKGCEKNTIAATTNIYTAS